MVRRGHLLWFYAVIIPVGQTHKSWWSACQICVYLQIQLCSTWRCWWENVCVSDESGIVLVFLACHVTFHTVCEDIESVQQPEHAAEAEANVRPRFLHSRVFFVLLNLPAQFTVKCSSTPTRTPSTLTNTHIHLNMHAGQSTIWRKSTSSFRMFYFFTFAHSQKVTRKQRSLLLVRLCTCWQ